MNVDYAFLCDFAQGGAKLNAMGIGFESIVGKQLPVRHPHFCLVMQIRTSSVEAGVKDMKVHLIDADGNDVIPVASGKINIPKAATGTDSIGRVVMEFNNVQFPVYDTYSVRAVIEGIEMVNLAFKVVPPPKKDNGQTA